jgi:hypothetical protein
MFLYLLPPLQEASNSTVKRIETRGRKLFFTLRNLAVKVVKYAKSADRADNGISLYNSDQQGIIFALF